MCLLNLILFNEFFQIDNLFLAIFLTGQRWDILEIKKQSQCSAVISGIGLCFLFSSVIIGSSFSLILSQIPRCKQRGIKLAALQSSGVFDPAGSRQSQASLSLAHCLRENKKKHRPRHSLWPKSVLLLRLQGLEPWTNRLRVYCSTN